MTRVMRASKVDGGRCDESLEIGPDPFEGIIGRSREIRTVIGTVRKVARSDVPVLICGESGTGKELVAKAIHERSTKRDGPFVVINCGAIPESLIESELFGHEKGAFTGAHVQRKGRLEMAQHGTLLLDEIGELSSFLQVKLLRFLQEHEIERLGGRSPIAVDTRIIAATNVNPEEAMADGRFREDLYYRLGVVVISMPPLRDRREDIQLLAQEFLDRRSQSDQRSLILTTKAIKVMEDYRWPGNVRELQNRIERAAIMAEDGKIKPEDLEITDQSNHGDAGLSQAREVVERQMIERALVRNAGNISRSAAELEISRPTLYERIEKLGIRRR